MVAAERLPFGVSCKRFFATFLRDGSQAGRALAPKPDVLATAPQCGGQ
jgi:hypothetical protein